MPYLAKPPAREPMYDLELSRLALENAERVHDGNEPVSDPEVVWRWLNTAPPEEPQD